MVIELTSGTFQKDAVRDLNGREMRGNRVRIELSKPRFCSIQICPSKMGRDHEYAEVQAHVDRMETVTDPAEIPVMRGRSLHLLLTDGNAFTICITSAGHLLVAAAAAAGATDPRVHRPEAQVEAGGRRGAGAVGGGRRGPVLHSRCEPRSFFLILSLHHRVIVRHSHGLLPRCRVSFLRLRCPGPRQARLRSRLQARSTGAEPKPAPSGSGRRHPGGSGGQEGRRRLSASAAPQPQPQQGEEPQGVQGAQPELSWPRLIRRLGHTRVAFSRMRSVRLVMKSRKILCLGDALVPKSLLWR